MIGQTKKEIHRRTNEGKESKRELGEDTGVV